MDAVLAAAETAFLRDGYEQTSMDAIAASADVSKRTVYNNFATKYDLYAAVVQRRLSSVLANKDEVARPTRNPRDELVELATEFLTSIYAPSEVELYTTVVSDARRFPEIGRLMIDGPIERSHAIMNRYLCEQVRLGRLQFPDIDLAAAQLIALLKTDVHMRLTLGQHVRLGPAAITKIARSCVALFLDGARSRDT